MWLGGLDISSKNIDQLDPLRGGYARIFLVRMPRFMEMLDNDLTKRFKQVHKKLLTLSFTEYFVLQCWRNGGNRCRYVHPARWEAYEEACEGYRRFMALAEAYADIVIARTEREIARIKAEDGRTKKASASRGRAG